MTEPFRGIPQYQILIILLRIYTEFIENVKNDFFNADILLQDIKTYPIGPKNNKAVGIDILPNKVLKNDA